MGSLVSCKEKKIAAFPATMHKEILGSLRRNKQVDSSISEPLHVPFEIIIEILSWLPVESLLRFKCVRKQWYSLIADEDEFIANQIARGSHSLLRYYQSPRGCLLAISDEHFKHIHSDAGLCLETRVGSRREGARIRNPATRRVVYLPDAHKDTYRLTFAMDSSTGECKVVCIYCISREFDDEGFASRGVGFQVLTVGKDEQWRPLEHPLQHQMEDADEGAARFCIFVCVGAGVVHASELFIWFDGSTYVQFYHLDVFSESFTTTIVTKGLSSLWIGGSYFLWDDRLAVGEITRGVLSVLVLEDSKQPKWSEKETIIPLKSLNQDDPIWESFDIADFNLNNEIVFQFNGRDGLRYDIKTDRTQVLSHSDLFEDFAAKNKSSLLSVKGMNPE